MKKQETTSEGFHRISKEFDYSEFDFVSFKIGAEWQQERMYSEQEVLHLLDTLWDRLDRWYNETEDNEFNLRKWFDECELKKK